MRQHGYPSYFSTFEAMGKGDLAEADRHGSLMVDTGRRFLDADLVALGVLVQGRVLVKRAEVRQGLALLDEAMLAALSDDLHPKWAGTLLCHLMDVCHELNDVARAAEWTAATVRWCENLPVAALFQGICRVHRSQLLTVRGAWPEAEREADAAFSDLAGSTSAFWPRPITRSASSVDCAVSLRQPRRSTARHRHGRDPNMALLCHCTLGAKDSGWRLVHAPGGEGNSDSGDDRGVPR